MSSIQNDYIIKVEIENAPSKNEAEKKIKALSEFLSKTWKKKKEVEKCL